MKKLFTSIEEIDNDEDYVDKTELSDVIQNNTSNITDEIETLNRSLEAIDLLINYRESLESFNDKSFTEKDKLMFRTTIEMLSIVTGDKPTHVVPSLESIDSVSLAFEAVDDAAKKSLNPIANRLKAMVSDFADNLQYIGNFFDTEKKTLIDISQAIKKSDKSKTKEITVTGAKYLQYSEDKSVKTIEEYIEKYKEYVEVMGPINRAVAEFTKNDFLNSYKTLFSVIHDYDGKYMEMFYRLEDFVLDIEKNISKISKTIKGDHITTIVSSELLGRGYFEVKKPTSYDRKKISSLKENSMNMNAALWRETKFSSDTGSVVFNNVSSKHGEEILKLSDELISSYQNFYSIKTKLSALGGLAIQGDFASYAVTPILQLLRLLFSNYRIMLRISVIVSSLTGNCFNLTKGNVQKALEIAGKTANS